MTLASDLADSPTSQGNRDMDTQPTGNNNHRVSFPLMKLSRELRDLVYQHSLSNSFPNPIPPRWVQGMQRVRGVSPETLDAKSFTNLQLANQQCHEEASLILYQDRGFQFDIAPTHATFLDACWLSGSSDWGGAIQDKKIQYMHRIKNVVLKANWDGHDGAGIRNFPWANWTEATSIICRELRGFPDLRRLTLDWRVPHPCGLLQPSRQQWLAISPCFEMLHKERPDIEMDVMAWQYVPRTLPVRYRESRTSLEDYMKELADAETLILTPMFLSCVISNN